VTKGRIERNVEVVNPLGFHARPAAAFVRLAGSFVCQILLEKDGVEVNGKSIMGVLMLAAEQGSTLVIRTDGDDAQEALSALSSLIENGFEEMHDVEGL
jgi:phosphocarrier protein